MPDVPARKNETSSSGPSRPFSVTVVRPEPCRSIVLAPSVVSELGKEIASPLRCRIEETPERICEVAGPMVLIGLGGRVGQLAAPKVPDRPFFKAEDVVNRLIPIFAVGHAMGLAHLLG